MDSEFYEWFLMWSGLAIFQYFLLLLLFAIACKLSSQVCEPEGLDLLFSVKSIVQLCAISRRVLVFDEFCVGEVDGRYWFAVMVFII